MFSLVRPSEVPSDLICAICMSVPLKPCALAVCEHIFCQECADSSLAMTPNCPIDRLACDLSQIRPLQPNSFAHRIWAGVLVECEGCTTWAGSIADFPKHQLKCKGPTPANNALTSEKEQEYLATIEALSFEVTLRTASQRSMESKNEQLRAQIEELQAALQAKNHALKTAVDVLATAIGSEDSDDDDDASNRDYDRSSILQLAQKMCQTLDTTRPVDCSANEIFAFVKTIYLDLKFGDRKHASSEHFRDDVKLILGIVGATSWLTRSQRTIIQSWCEEQGW